MVACAKCARELQPTWKYCISCGTRTTVPLTDGLPGAIRPTGSGTSLGPETPARRVDVLAILALVFGCLVGLVIVVVGFFIIRG